METLTKRDNTNIIKAMKNVLKKLNLEPEIVYSDLGSEFVSKPFAKLMKEEGIEHITTNLHASIVERVHRTIKTMLEKNKTANKVKTWESIMDDIVFNYNNTYHSSIGLEPSEVNNENKHIA